MANKRDKGNPEHSAGTPSQPTSWVSRVGNAYVDQGARLDGAVLGASVEANDRLYAEQLKQGKVLDAMATRVKGFGEALSAGIKTSPAAILSGRNDSSWEKK